MDLTHYTEVKPHYIKRIIWTIFNHTFFRLLIGNINKPLRIWILKRFGTKVEGDSDVYNTVNIFAPWNLSMVCACIGPNVTIYNKDLVKLGHTVVISQGAYLCTASHDITDKYHKLITAPITIHDKVWVAANAFIGMGVTIGEGAVVGATASVYKDVEPWTVVGGNPAKFIKKRVIVDE